MQHGTHRRHRLSPAITGLLAQGYTLDQIRDSARREYCNRSLRAFTKYAWPVVEPVRPFVDNWHIGAVAEHLEACSNNQLRKLLILVPPGTMKSLETSVFWPAWEWGPRGLPHRRYIFTSYASHLSVRDSMRCRRVIRSPWYQNNWGDKYSIQDDRNTLALYHNSVTGFRLATSTDSIATGERGDVVVADDPHNVMKVESDKKRWHVVQWWDEAMSSRINDPDESTFIIIMQRLHQGDLAGHVSKQEGYEVLCLPMEFEKQHRCYTKVRPKDYTGPKRKRYCWDPRKKEGELLFPKRFNRKYVNELKESLGSYAAAAQLQQRPSPRGGGMIKLSWFGRYRERPGPNKIIRIIQSWDTANKAGIENAYSVCGTWAQCDTGMYLLHVLRRRMNNATLRRTAPIMAVKHKADAIIIEDKASGTALIEHMRDPREHGIPNTTFNVFEMHPDVDKVTRMDIESPTIEAGNVHLPEEADWLPDFEGEIEAFPNSNYMDQADMVSQTLKWVKRHTVEQDWGFYD